jgi:hypothetical protein
MKKLSKRGGISIAGGVLLVLGSMGFLSMISYHIDGMDSPRWHKEKTIDTEHNPAPPHWEVDENASGNNGVGVGGVFN